MGTKGVTKATRKYSKNNASQRGICTSPNPVEADRYIITTSTLPTTISATTAVATIAVATIAVATIAVATIAVAGGTA